jgi:hypothetical protein
MERDLPARQVPQGDDEFFDVALDESSDAKKAALPPFSG